MKPKHFFLKSVKRKKDEPSTCVIDFAMQVVQNFVTAFFHAFTYYKYMHSMVAL